MATFASDLIGLGSNAYVTPKVGTPSIFGPTYTSQKMDELSKLSPSFSAPTSFGPSQTPAVQTSSVPSAPGTGNQSALAGALKQVTSAPAPVPAASQPYNASQDAYGANSNPSGLTAQQMSSLAELQMRNRVLGQSAAAPGTLVTGAQMGATPSGPIASTPVNFQAYSYGANNQGGFSSSAPAPKGTAGYVAPVTNALSNEQLLANYKPEAVQGMYGGNEYSTTNAGLKAPDPRNFSNPSDYAAAQDTFNKLSLQEQETEANSQARQYVDSQNAAQAATDEMRRRVMAADSAQKEIALKNNAARVALAQRLASRGLDPTTDTWAQKQVDDLDRLDREEQQAAAQVASLDASTLRTQANDAARKALVERIAGITAAKESIAKAQESKDKAATDLLLAQSQKAKDEAAAKNAADLTALKERETALKEARNPAMIKLDEARATGLITEADYVRGVKTLAEQAGIEKTKAETNRINTLTPLEAQKLRAEVNKTIASGSAKGSSTEPTTDEEWNKAYDALLLAGRSTSKQEIANAVRRSRGEKVPSLTETSLKGVKAKSEASKAAQTNLIDSIPL